MKEEEYKAKFNKIAESNPRSANVKFLIEYVNYLLTHHPMLIQVNTAKQAKACAECRGTGGVTVDDGYGPSYHAGCGKCDQVGYFCPDCKVVLKRKSEIGGPSWLECPKCKEVYNKYAWKHSRDWRNR